MGHESPNPTMTFFVNFPPSVYSSFAFFLPSFVLVIFYFPFSSVGISILEFMNVVSESFSNSLMLGVIGFFIVSACLCFRDFRLMFSPIEIFILQTRYILLIELSR